ncbi:septum site-determining protein DivIVA [Clostridium tepidiprofundi DSM 19306]|uniref:Septum site-determining protein DivIVA n=1 Tax=Clostridium tepidiprofundi DSM 19306 TaxID=1121338 RepID=A0A151B785_9CLOT|nr:DivIVA domain-containing protein [Clostridium tepidiprofundi]KYH35663.1 septum site-determining protein DivIVA [Clostridium tepidiprofundi DSM 19306]
MRITSMDIENKEFKRTVRGYNPYEVDEFLDQIAEDYEALYKENSILNEKISILDEKIEHYKKIESTIQKTLVLAQNSAEQVKLSAQKEAELIIKDANDAAQKIIDKANNDVLKINDEFDRIRREFNKFRTKYRNFMNSQIELFERMEKNFDEYYSLGKSIKEEIKEKSVDMSEANISNDFNVNDINKEIGDADDLETIKTFFANR